MKSVILFIKSFWKPIVFVLFFVIVFSSIGINRCVSEKNEVVAEKANTSILRAFLIDSCNTAAHEKEILRLDSVKTKEASNTAIYAQSARYWQKIADQYGKTAIRYRAQADSMSQYAAAECKPFLDAYRQANDSLQKENMALDSTNMALDNEAKGYSRQLFLSEKQVAHKDSIIIEKKKYIGVLETNIGNLQCYREWGNSHPFLKWLFGWKCKK